MPSLSRPVRKSIPLALIAFIAAVSFGKGCGLIADEDRIVIAELDGKKITRAKLYSIIYDMPDKERPNIRSRQDYLRVLNNYIDEQIKFPLGDDLSREGKISIPRELAREAYFTSITDEEEQKTQRHMWNIPIPEAGKESELMQVYELTAESIKFSKDMIDQGTDKILERLLGEQAVSYLAMEAFRNKDLVLDEEKLRFEYELSKDSYKTLERLTILGLQFPTSVESSGAEASRVRERLNAGEDFDAILDEYIIKSRDYAIESVIENNPTLDRFRGFWQEASGAKVGEVRGPVFMPDYTRMKRDNDGQIVQAVVPECFLVFEVLEYVPESVKPFEEAVNAVAPIVAYAAMMERLRDEHGVVIFEDKLPNPSGGTSTMLSS
jgi:hypothetical protein